jgi:DNA mismatch endonuclease, patch repair protein
VSVSRVIPSSEAASKRMRSNRRTDTGPELAFRSALHGLGLRFRKDFPIRLPSRSVRPDVVFTKARIAVFIDGCFWHGCPDHGTLPRANRKYWEAKLVANRKRDLAVDAALRDGGWSVLRFWAHEDAAGAAQEVADLVRRT